MMNSDTEKTINKDRENLLECGQTEQYFPRRDAATASTVAKPGSRWVVSGGLVDAEDSLGESKQKDSGVVSWLEMRIVGVKAPSDPPPRQSCALGK